MKEFFVKIHVIFLNLFTRKTKGIEEKWLTNKEYKKYMDKKGEKSMNKKIEYKMIGQKLINIACATAAIFAGIITSIMIIYNIYLIH